MSKGTMEMRKTTHEHPSTTFYQLKDWIQWFHEELGTILGERGVVESFRAEDQLLKTSTTTLENRIKKGLIMILQGMNILIQKHPLEGVILKEHETVLLIEALSCIYEEKGTLFQYISHHCQHSVREALLKLESCLSELVFNENKSHHDYELVAQFSQFCMMALMFRLQNYDLLMMQPQSFEELACRLKDIFIKPDTQKERMLSYLLDPLFKEIDEGGNFSSMQIGSMAENVRRRCCILRHLSLQSKDSQLKLELIFGGLQSYITPQVIFHESMRRNLEQAIQAFFEPLSMANLSHHALIETVEGMKKKVFLIIIQIVATCSEEDMRVVAGNLESVSRNPSPSLNRSTTANGKPRKKKQKQTGALSDHSVSQQQDAPSNVLSHMIDALLNVLGCNVVFTQKLLNDVFAIIKILATSRNNKQRIELLLRVMESLRKHLMPINSDDNQPERNSQKQQQHLQYGLFIRSAFCLDENNHLESFEM
ncbi:hypothetical protein C9374_010795 [Naegleria lovaniensis]|uniref:Uncharacterized protein n=1 Tax=Naegleria lovaniensis TaxID=51637 RepID=A0AA88KFZ2_NAELO|nr:uncharacterized protein C9374_010795 [Naegleria lovaniensis]KAG2374511.1 hypothetical protein C9374_010795 [Naegleria lovaniensis]